ncbi:hypothetical protein [Cytobacillus praedii]|uniref:hypothetical protein n=1 Tax=Cytobacillus praedii TaxID=1742358 RepID=UPI002E1C469F|nr:hypothetical protein [Cytobacillus praedii]
MKSMLYSVDFSIQVNGCFSTIHTAFIHATTVSECKDLAEDIKVNLPESKSHHVHIFIEA